MAASAPLPAQTELGSEDDLTVRGQDGTASDPDVEIYGFSVFGATQAAYTGITAAPGNVVVNGALSVSSGAYLVGSSTFPAASKIFINDGTAGQMLRKNAAGHLEWTSASALGDNLGDHTATTMLNMASWNIVGVSSVNFAPNVFLTSAAAANYGGVLVSTHVYMTGSVLNVASMTMVGKGLQVGTNLTSSASGIFISTAGSIMTIGVGNGANAPNARGIGAVDLQTARSMSYEVASGGYAVVGGGENNSATTSWAVVAGGYGNTASGMSSAMGGGSSNTASGIGGVVGGGNNNKATNELATIPGGQSNTAGGMYSFAAGYAAMASADGSFAWADSQGVLTENNTPDRTVFKNRGGFLVTGSTNPAITGTRDRGMLVTGNGLVGISTGVPYAALDVVSTGTTAGSYAQIWRNANGVEVASMTSTGLLYATVSGAASSGDNLGDHTATQPLDLAQNPVINVSSLTMVGDGLRIATDLAGSAGGLFISTSGAIMTIGVGNGTVAAAARGVGAVDLQTYRTNSMYASTGAYSVTGGGYDNDAGGDYSTVGGGTVNVAAGMASTVGGGGSNTASAIFASVGGGASNSARGIASTVPGGSGNTAGGLAATVAGGMDNAAIGASAVVAGGRNNTAAGDYSFAGGSYSSSTVTGAFTWSDSQGVETDNNVKNRVLFKARGGFLVTGSTDTNMTGALDRGVMMTGNGLVGISTGAPQAALDVVSTGTADAVWAQIWRNSSGVEVASITSTGKLYATLPSGAGNDNLGNHTATKDLNMSGFGISVSSLAIPASGLQIGTAFGGSPNGVLIRTDGTLITIGLGNGSALPNARGTGSVELQTVRDDPTQVASGDYSVISGGAYNQAGYPGIAYVSVGGGYYNLATSQYATISGGNMNRASGWASAVSGGLSNKSAGNYSSVPGGFNNEANGAYSLAAGYYSSSTANGSFTWADSQGQVMNNTVADRALFKARGGFIVTGSTNTNMTGTLNRGVFITGNGLVGISTGAPQAALDVVSTGTTDAVWAQIWRDGNGVAVASMTSQGTLYATVANGDNLGNHTATTNLNMAMNSVVNVASITMSGSGLQIATDLTAAGNGIFISTAGAVQTMGVGNGSTAPGARGIGAVDLQTYRGSSLYASTGAYSVTGGGYNNDAGGNFSTIPGGQGNMAINQYATTSGGYYNTASGLYSTVSGGNNNTASASYSTVIGGSYNTASGLYSTVSGTSNTASNTDATVSGGKGNKASNGDATVSGGYYNTASGLYSTASGGTINIASGDYATVSGGYKNTAKGNYSFAAGSYSSSTVAGAFTWSDSQGVETANTIADRTLFKNRGGFLITGSTNPAMSGTADRGVFITGNGLVGVSTGVPYAALDVVSTGTLVTQYAQIWRGSDGVAVASITANGKLTTLQAMPGDNLGDHTATQNLNMAQNSVINIASVTMVGQGLQIGTDLTAAAGGVFISTTGAVMTIGTGNGTAAPNARGIGAVDMQTYRGAAAQVASGKYSSISGGQYNTASNINSVVAGGYSNTASGQYSSVAGGKTDIASGDYSSVSGGTSNTAAGTYAVVSGGYTNKASGNASVVAGGYTNAAGGIEASILGGSNNYANGSYSTITGGAGNAAPGSYSTVAGGSQNTANGAYSFAAGNYSSSTVSGAFTWSDSQGVEMDNIVADRTLFKNRGGFLVTGSTSPVMSGGLNRGVFITGNGLVGISTGVPYAALDVVSTGTTVNEYAQIWRNSGGTPVASMTATGLLYASLPAGVGNDNLGNHTATTQLKMGNYAIYSSSAITAAVFQINGSTMVAVLPGNNSIAYGLGAGANNSAGGDYNLFLGNGAGAANTTGTSGVFVGYQAGYSNGDGYGNVYIGDKAGYSGSAYNEYNTFIGYNSGYTNNAGSQNTFLGGEAGYHNTAGDQNTMVGYDAGYVNVSGDDNTYIGQDAGYYTKGSANSILGSMAGVGGVVATYSSSTLVGYQAGNKLTTGGDNIFLGYKAGYSVTTGTGNIVIGYDQGTSAAAANNEMNIGGVIYGNLSSKNVGISTAAPQAKLDINTAGAANVGQIIQGVSGQTADLQQWQSNGGTVVGRVAADGKTAVGGSTAPTYKLEVQSSGASTFQVDPQAGYVSLRIGGVEVARLKP